MNKAAFLILFTALFVIVWGAFSNFYSQESIRNTVSFKTKCYKKPLLLHIDGHEVLLTNRDMLGIGIFDDITTEITSLESKCDIEEVKNVHFYRYSNYSVKSTKFEGRYQKGDSNQLINLYNEGGLELIKIDDNLYSYNLGLYKIAYFVTQPEFYDYNGNPIVFVCPNYSKTSSPNYCTLFYKHPLGLYMRYRAYIKNHEDKNSFIEHAKKSHTILMENVVN